MTMRPDEDRFGSSAWSAHADSSPKPRVPRFVDVLAEKIDQLAEEVAQTYIDVLYAQKAVAVRSEGVTELRMVPDYALRLRAAEAIHDRLVASHAKRWS
jgi:hypothetical protein